MSKLDKISKDLIYHDNEYSHDDPIDNILKKIEDILNSFKFFGIYFSDSNQSDK